jgi:hypothetical protein
VIGLGGQQAVIEQKIQDAAGSWNHVQWFEFLFNNTSCTQFNYNVCVDAANLNNVGILAVTDWGNPPPPLTLNKANIVLNTQLAWHVNGNDPDVYEVTVHEFGHVLGLYDFPDENWPNDAQDSPMWYSGQKKLPYIDDKEATTMLYGIWTQFEVSQFLGLNNALPFYQQSVHSYSNCATGYPDYWTYDPPVLSPNGGRAMRFSGCAVGNGASPNFAYMPIAVAEHDGTALYNPQVPACGNPCYLQVRNGLTLKWEQYNTSTCTVSIDLEFSDGTTLRDSGLVDNFGVNVHPSQRTCFAAWRSISVDLSPLAGKTIKRWLIAYDNPNASGTWRSYIDNLRVNY